MFQIYYECNPAHTTKATETGTFFFTTKEQKCEGNCIPVGQAVRMHIYMIELF